MKDLHIRYFVPESTLKEMSAYYPTVIGHLTGGGQSHYRFPANYLCPHILVSGEGILKLGNREVRLKAGDMFTIWPGQLMDYREDPSNRWKFYYMHVRGEQNLNFARACGFSENRMWFTPDNPEKAKEVFAGIFELCKNPRENLEYAIMALFNRLPDACREQPEKLRSKPFKNLIENAVSLIGSASHQGINISELSEILEVDRSTLFRKFRRQLGMTPVEYLNRHKITRAGELLRTTEYSVKDIARMCGFSSEKYFFKRFKQLTGATPSEFRRGTS